MASFIKVGDVIKFKFNPNTALEHDVAKKISKAASSGINTEQDNNSLVQIEKKYISKAVKAVFYLYKQAYDSLNNPFSRMNTLFPSTVISDEEKQKFEKIKGDLKGIMDSLKKCILELADDNSLTADLTTELSAYCQTALTPKTGPRRLVSFFSPYESSNEKYKAINDKITSQTFNSNKDLLEAVMDTLIENPNIADVRLWGKSTTTQYLLNIINNVITARTSTEMRSQQP